jgi:DNA-directed RNA polymerase subunit RPC12/RpoP
MNKCDRCGKEFPDKELYIRVDGNNISITKNAKTYCKNCYIKVYGRND